MADPHPLPTVEQAIASAEVELNVARSALDGAAAWLRSDWSGPPPTPAQAARRRALSAAIRTARKAFDDAW